MHYGQLLAKNLGANEGRSMMRGGITLNSGGMGSGTLKRLVQDARTAARVMR